MSFFTDENGKRHFRMTADPGKLGSKGGQLGAEIGPGVPHVVLGAHLYTDEQGRVQACTGGTLKSPLKIMQRDGNTLWLRIDTGSVRERTIKLTFASTDMATQVEAEIFTNLHA